MIFMKIIATIIYNLYTTYITNNILLYMKHHNFIIVK